jgi:NTE family protein
LDHNDILTDKPEGRFVKKPLALVIGSGAVKCAAALGLWRVLSQAGIPIDLLVGCSGGSLFAATMALGLDVDECIEMTQRLWDRRVTEKRHTLSLLRAVLPRVFGFNERFGMVDDRVMLQQLNSVFGERTFEDTRTPLYVVATDFQNGEQVVLSKGRLVDALRASVSIPFIWPPWPVNGRLLIDGSASDPMPVDVAIKDGAEIILAMGFESAYPRKVKSISRFAFQVNSIMTNNLLKANFAFHNLAHHAEIIAIIPELEQSVGLFDTARFSYVIAQGERAMRAQLPYLERLLVAESPPF